MQQTYHNTAHQTKMCVKVLMVNTAWWCRLQKAYLIVYTLYSEKFSWGPNFILFVLSLSEQNFNTQNIHYDGRVFLSNAQNKN